MRRNREGHPTVAALMEECLLGTMLSGEVGVPPEAPPPRPSTYGPADRTTIRPLQG